MPKSLEGGCLCGVVRYEIQVSPVSTSICHCVTCRRAAGAESVAWAVCPTSAFKLTGANPVIYQSSNGVTRTFCQHCGTSLTYQIKADFIDVALATLDDPEQVVPTKEVWTESRISWNALHGNLPIHPKDSQ